MGIITFEESRSKKTETATNKYVEYFLQPGDIVYGRFTGVVNHTNSNATLLGYRG